jgi:hypothetical protein
LREGKTQISGLRVYALFSEGDECVSERDLVPHIVWYNENCVSDPSEIIDGVAINNEAYDRTWTEERMVTYLDHLYGVRVEADKQLPSGSLLTHFSVGWIWGTDHNGDKIHVTWNGTLKPIMHHFVDIFDSLDIQVMCSSICVHVYHSW